MRILASFAGLPAGLLSAPPSFVPRTAAAGARARMSPLLCPRLEAPSACVSALARARAHVDGRLCCLYVRERESVCVCGRGGGGREWGACAAHIKRGLHVGAPLNQRLHHLQLALLRGDVQRRSSSLHRRRRRVSPCERQRAPAPVPPPSRPPTGAFLLATVPPALPCCCCTAQHALGASWTRSTCRPICCMAISRTMHRRSGADGLVSMSIAAAAARVHAHRANHDRPP
jgi:hypothetical protein